MSYKTTTVKTLRQQCRESGIKGYSRLTKQGLWNLLEDVSGKADLEDAQHRVAQVVAELALKGYGVNLGPVYLKGSNGEGDPSPKEVWQGGQIDDQDRGGIPHPGQLEAAMTGPIVSNGTTTAPPGYMIVRRKGQATFTYMSIQTDQVEILKRLGWSFSLKAGSIRPRARRAVAARPANGKKAMMQAPEGKMIFARRGNLVTRVGHTADKAGWLKKGWTLHLRAG